MSNYTYPDVYVEKQSTPRSTSIATSGAYIGGLIGKAERGPVNTAVLISSWNEYMEKFAYGLESPFNATSYLAFAVYGFFQNGGTQLYVVNASDGTEKAATKEIGGVTVNAIDTGVWGNSIYVAITAAGSAFDVSVYCGDSATDDTLVETFKGVTIDNIAASINDTSDFIKVATPTAITATTATALAGGKSGVANLSKALAAIDSVDDIAMLSYVDSGALSDNETLLSYCDTRGDIQAVLGVSSETIKTLEQANADIPLTGRLNAVFPWIKVSDPISNVTINVPNCGHYQGMVVRMTQTYGLEKVPAGTSAAIRGAVSLATELGKAEAGEFNEANICCLISKANYGIVCWGGRSRFENGRYISSILLETKITRDMSDGLQTYIFEPNTATTWAKVQSALSVYLRGLWNEGVFNGTTENEAFLAICDQTTNTDKTIAKRELHATVAYKEKDCAEFIIVKLSHVME